MEEIEVLKAQLAEAASMPQLFGARPGSEPGTQPIYETRAQRLGRLKLDLTTALADLKEALKGTDAEAIKTKTNTLAQASMKLGEAMYQASQGGADGAEGAADSDELPFKACAPSPPAGASPGPAPRIPEFKSSAPITRASRSRSCSNVS